MNAPSAGLRGLSEEVTVTGTPGERQGWAPEWSQDGDADSGEDRGLQDAGSGGGGTARRRSRRPENTHREGPDKARGGERRR